MKRYLLWLACLAFVAVMFSPFTASATAMDNAEKMTGERLALFDEIYAQHGHIDAEELLRALQSHGQKTSRATVYSRRVGSAIRTTRAT